MKRWITKHRWASLVACLCLSVTVCLGAAYTTTKGTYLALGPYLLVGNYTITLTNSMSASDMQAEIDAAPHIIWSGATLTFQFSDSTSYSLSSGLQWSGFTIHGTLVVQGNTGDSSYNPGTTDPSVKLGFSAGVTGDAITIKRCYGSITIRNLEVEAAGTTGFHGLITVQQSTYVSVYRCVGDAPSGAGYNILFSYGSTGAVQECWVDHATRGITATHASFVLSWDNDDISANPPSYGAGAYYGSTIAQYDSDQPSGTTAPTITANGSQIIAP